MKFYFSVNNDFPASSPWWRLGGDALWGRVIRAGYVTGEQRGYYVPDNEEARQFLQEAVNIKGWWDGHISQPHPLKVKVME